MRVDMVSCVYFPIIAMSKASAAAQLHLDKDSSTFAFPTEQPTEVTDQLAQLGNPTVRVVAHDHNVTQKLITVTEDKAMLCLQRNMAYIGKRRWLHPFSLLITLMLALATSDFNKLAWISSDLLKATFIVASVLTTGWLLWEIIHDAKLKEIPQVIEDIFTDIRG